MATVARTFDVLAALEENDGWGITELATALSLPKSSVHRHLKTLEEAGFVVREGDDYYLSLRFLYYGTIARRRYDPQSTIRAGVQYIAEQTNERAQFMIWEHDAVVYAYRELGERAVQTGTMVGKRMPIHATSGGKVMLANLSEDDRNEFLDSQELEPYTDSTITDRGALVDELQRIQRKGYAVNDQEYIDGLRAVSVPLRTPDGGVIGSLGISGPTHRLDDERCDRELPDLLLGVANEIELNYLHGNPSSTLQ